MKKLLYIIIGLVVLYVILAFIGPKQVKVERQITIDRPAADVTKAITDYKYFHDNWSPWTAKDPNMEVAYSGTPGDVGHHYSWKGNKDVGSGSMTYMGTNGDTLLEKLSFEGEGDAKTYHILKEENGKTNVTWGLMFDVGFFRRAPMLFINMDKMMGGDLESGLSSMKKAVESHKSESTSKYEIKEIDWPAVAYAGKKETVTFQNMPAFFGKNFGALMSDKSIKALSPPSGLFSSFDEKNQKADVAACVKVDPAMKAGKWEVFQLPASKVLHVAYYGAYEKSMNAHTAIGDYMKAHDMHENVVIEEYMTDPTKVKDTAQWLTNIYYVLK